MEQTYTKFRDVPQFVRDGTWECHYTLISALEFIDELVSGRGVTQRLDIDPDFQRGHVWNEQQQIAWLEFNLRGGKTGNTIYLNNPGWQTSYEGWFVLVDGKQRLEAIRAFVNNQIKVFGTYYKDYTDRISITDGGQIKINVNTLKTRAEVLQWYLGFNSGGTPHTKKEIARVYQLLSVEQGLKT